MGKVFAPILGWLGWKAASLLLIIAVLVAGAWVQGELRRADQLAAERSALVALKDGVARHIKLTGRDLGPSQAAALQTLIAEREKARDDYRAAHWFASRIQLTESWQKLKAMEAEIAVEREMLAKVNAVDARIASLESEIQKGFKSRFVGVIRAQLPTALAILAGIILVPIGIKLVLYYFVAPLATGRAPVRILEGGVVATAAHLARSQDGRMSAVSQSVVLAPDEELLVQPDYLQSSSTGARKRTRWLLSWTIPWSSLLSGMFLLTRVAPSGNDPIVISATGDSLSEVGILELAEGEAFVCQPRSLVGVIQKQSRPIRITRHWRLGHLHSWLTLQLRFLAFHGPAKLVVQGCRGIRVEAAGQGRLINQAATLGFSANIDYANTRCETFVSYWRGKEDLFNDLFTGEGIYVYEETTDPKRDGGITGRGLEGFVDAVLKLVGI